jgi:hypothetical protein
MSISEGINTTSDSEFFKILAESFYNNGTLVHPEFGEILYWPPLYPIILSAGIRYFDMYVIVLHFICGIAIIYIWMILSKEFFRDKFLFITFNILSAISTPFIMISVFVWSELIFLLLLSLYLLHIERYISSKTVFSLIMASLFGALLLLQRNAGIFLVIGFMFGLVIFYSKWVSNNWKLFLTHFLFVVSGSVIWNFKKIILDSQINLLNELIPELTVFRNFYLIFKEIGSLFIPGILFSAIVFVFGLIVILFISVSILQYQNNKILKVWLVMIVSYLAAWVVIPFDKYEIGRFLSVILPVLYFLIFIVLSKIVINLNSRYKAILYSVITIWLVYPLFRVFFNSLLWGNSPLYEIIDKYFS